MRQTLTPKRLRVAGLLGATLLVGMLTACTTDGSNATYVRMCENKTTAERVADKSCAKSPKDVTAAQDGSITNYYLWYYVLNSSSYSAPSVGSRLSSGSTVSPEDDDDEIDEDVPEDGGEVSDDTDGVTQEDADTAEDSDSSVTDDDDSGSVDDDTSSDDDDFSSFSGDDD